MISLCLKELETSVVWIKTLYKNVSSLVTNNGFATPSFNLTIVLELLAISVRNNDQVSGIVVDGNDLKLVMYSDDITSFVRDKQSYLSLFNTIFSPYLVLCVNHGKTKIILKVTNDHRKK